MARFENPIPQYILSTGKVAAGGSLEFFVSGTDTPLVIYGDNDESSTIDNPVTLGDRGEVPNIFFSVAARVRLFDADGNQLFDVDPVVPGGGGSGGLEAYSNNTTYSVLDIVYADDSQFYISIANDNTGNDPIDDTDDSPYWTRLEFIKRWNNQEIFGINQIVLRDTAFYASTIADNQGNDPSTDTLGQWINLSAASRSPYVNTASNLTATDVQTAIDEVVNLINALPSATVYRGVLDVSAGDAALPGSPVNGDVYVIGVGGTITVSVNGAAPAPTAVTEGQRIAYNSGTGAWDLTPAVEQAAAIQYSNVTSGLDATNVQNAIDEVEDRTDTLEVSVSGLQSTVAGLGDGVEYRGQLDVSAGDSALPASPAGGDLYAISTGGTITVSVNGAPPAATAVTAGQQIVYNAVAPAWDLQASTTSAGQISYDNTGSGLSGVTVQAAIDENAAAIGVLEQKDSVFFGSVNASTSFSKRETLNDLTVVVGTTLTLTLNDLTFINGDLVRVRKTREAGALNITTTNTQNRPDGTFDTTNTIPDGLVGTVELRYNGSTWDMRIY